MGRVPLFYFLLTGSAWAQADTLGLNPAVTRSPYRAMLLSAVTPAGGQFYTGNRLKGIALAGAELTLLGLTAREHIRTEDHWDRYTRTGDQREYELYVRGYDRRATLVWWAAGVWVLSVADAYVSAYLYKFDDQERLTLRMTPADQRPTLGICLRW